jgi:hypothetical protein
VIGDPAVEVRSTRDAEVRSAPLVEYAERLLLGTGLDVEQAVRIARGEQEAPAELISLAEALRAGWNLSAGREPA